MDLDRYRDLLDQREKINAEIYEIRKKERDVAIETIWKMMRDFDLSIADLERKRARSKRGPRPGYKLAPRYIDPVTQATWSGRGRMPRWLIGKDPEKYRIVQPTDVS
ncbi:H-NS histone family protein [Burkholderia territorii]|uniref:H-NS histone family protein n=1 Tax=Burkholderia territorii TaxID=1503055 RepID=UPI0007584A43|nr:H-NS histone family protein [Burkholderia territorii]KWA08218.1 hypothetical protein WT37_26575 [Burkholderia territorii]